MLFKSSFMPSFLLAFAVLARRHRGQNHSEFLSRIEQSTNAASDKTIYSNNWSGAIWDMGDGTFDFVAGTFTVPVPQGPTGSAASAWVGIDGYTCKSGLLQTGVDFIVGDNGPTYTAWYEWLPDGSVYFQDFPISPGDVITAAVALSSMTSGIVMLENITQNHTALRDVNSPNTLCGKNAEWIIEDYGQNSGQVPLANFGTVTFTEAVATGTVDVQPEGAVICLLRFPENATVLTSVTFSKSSVTISHV